jgi:hypothetical protein
MTLRHFAKNTFESTRPTRLMEMLRTRPIPLSSLTYEPGPAEDGGDLTPSLLIVAAALGPRYIEMRCQPEDGWSTSTSFSALLISRDETLPALVEVTERSPAEWRLRIDTLSDSVNKLVQDEDAVYVELHAKGPGHHQQSGRIWLPKPHLLILSAEERARRHALALMTEEMFVPGSQLRQVAEWLLGNVDILTAALSQTIPEDIGSGRNKGSGGTVEAVGPDDPLDDDTFEGDDGSRLPGSERKRRRSLARLDEHLRVALRLSLPMFSRSSTSSGRDGDVGRHPQKDNSGAHVAGGGDQKGNVPVIDDRLADDLIRSIADDLRQAVERITAVQATPANIARALNTLEAYCVFLYRLELHACLWTSKARAHCTRARQFAFSRAFALSGWEQGRCKAWLVRAWANPELHDGFAELWQDPDRIARLATLAAAGALIAREEGAGLGDVLVGLQYCADVRSLVRNGDLRERLANHAKSLASQSGGLVTARSILAKLPELSLEDTSGGIALKPWLPFKLRRTDGPITFDTMTLERLTQSDDSSLRSRARQLLTHVKAERSVAFLSCDHHIGPSCSNCAMSLPSLLVQRLSHAGAVLHQCPNCNVPLIPMAPDDPVCGKLLMTWDQSVGGDRI